MAIEKMQYTTVKIRLHPTLEQEELIEKTFGCCRYLWNKMLEDVQEFYAATDLQYIPTPAHYKKEAPFLKEVDSQALCTVHQNLRKAFLAFFRAPGAFGYPQFKSKKVRKDSFTIYCREYRTGPSIYLTGNIVPAPEFSDAVATADERKGATIQNCGRTREGSNTLNFAKEAKTMRIQHNMQSLKSMVPASTYQYIENHVPMLREILVASDV